MPLTDEQRADAYQSAFFHKLANDHGLQPDSEESAQGFLALGANARKLAAAKDRRVTSAATVNVKKANSFLERYFTGDAALDQLVGAHTAAAK